MHSRDDQPGRTQGASNTACRVSFSGADHLIRLDGFIKRLTEAIKKYLANVASYLPSLDYTFYLHLTSFRRQPPNRMHDATEWFSERVRKRKARRKPHEFGSASHRLLRKPIAQQASNAIPGTDGADAGADSDDLPGDFMPECRPLSLDPPANYGGNDRFVSGC